MKTSYPYQYNYLGKFGQAESIVIYAESLTQSNAIFEQHFPYATETEVEQDLS